MKVLAKPFRDRYWELQSQGVKASEIAARCGYFRGGNNNARAGQPDVSRLRRNMALETGKNGRRDRRHIDYEVAVRLARAMDMDPHEAGV